MATTIKLKNSVTTTNAPSSLVQGEVAINITDKKVWVGNAATTPIQLLGDGGSASFTSIAFGAGTVSNPSITFTGDTNTGIYSPAADTIAFTEGGSEAMRINSSGNVGIGTTSPVGLLDVVSSGSGVIRMRSSTGSGTVGFQAQNNDTGTTSTDGTFFGIDGSEQAYVYNYENAPLIFGTNNAERMRIDSSGNVSIGTTTPGYLGNPADLCQIAVNRVPSSGVITNSAKSAAFINLDGSSGGSSIQFATAAANNTDPTERMRIDSSGNVGIGGTPVSVASTKTLTIYDATEARIQLQNSTSGATSTDGSTIAIAGADLYINNRENGNQLFFVNGSERMRISSGGNLYIGTTAGSSKVMVDATGNGTFGHINSGNTAENGNTPWLATLNNSTVASADYGWTFYDSSATGNLLLYRRNGSTTGNLVMTWARGTGDVTVAGALSKGSGSFRIDHPLPQLSETHQLVHSFVEAPQADLIYRGKATLQNGKAIVNIDESAGMTEGTFVALCREVQCFTSNESDWDAVRGSVNGNLLTIECQNNQSTATISWLVIGERQDKHMYETSWTDENGKVIVEPLK